MSARPIEGDPAMISHPSTVDYLNRAIDAINESTRILRADNDAARKHSPACYCWDCCRRANAERINRAMLELIAQRDEEWTKGEAKK